MSWSAILRARLARLEQTANFDESADELAPTVLEGDNEHGGPC